MTGMNLAMNRSLFGRALVVWLAVLLTGIVSGAATAQDSLGAVGISDINDAPAMFAKAVAEGDAQRLGSFYDENAILFSPDGSVAQGRNNIAQLYANNARIGPNQMIFKQVSMESEGDRASIVWLWDLVITPRGQPPQTITGRSLLYLNRTPFGWKIIFDMFQIVPRPATE